MDVTLSFLFPKRGIYLVGDDGTSAAQLGLSHDVIFLCFVVRASRYDPCK
jgi:hypothetical protein